MNLALHKNHHMVVFLLRIDRDTNYNFILLIIEKLIIIFYLLFLLWLTHQRRGISHVEST
ncbi:hypothetical protein FDB76_04650 [Acinetobacter baumannii]|nr:hypothetical protein FDB76_04650 [Acinetobacter baumannii]QCP19225.1 hypothetical protein FDE89_02750 [Acinetobacter baumannii]